MNPNPNPNPHPNLGPHPNPSPDPPRGCEPTQDAALRLFVQRVPTAAVGRLLRALGHLMTLGGGGAVLARTMGCRAMRVVLGGGVRGVGEELLGIYHPSHLTQTLTRNLATLTLTLTLTLGLGLTLTLTLRGFVVSPPSPSPGLGLGLALALGLGVGSESG